MKLIVWIRIWSTLKVFVIRSNRSRTFLATEARFLSSVLDKILLGMLLSLSILSKIAL